MEEQVTDLTPAEHDDILQWRSAISTALDLCLQAWRTTEARVRFMDALGALGQMAAALDAERARNRNLDDDLAHAVWSEALMTAQRDEAFKHLTKDQQRECIKQACRAVQSLTVNLLDRMNAGEDAAALAVLEEPQ